MRNSTERKVDPSVLKAGGRGAGMVQQTKLLRDESMLQQRPYSANCAGVESAGEPQKSFSNHKDSNYSLFRVVKLQPLHFCIMWESPLCAAMNKETALDL